ncbi:hypothetical protein EPI10_014728 [Gossypium australe]|uniref:Uncharacterized protein n=1 Tax=Gossypium australe TaxID=47621 RepID=A0A5B6VIK9_9ROSI|nr:hypothetical protein EPI10_014728 [Gossypium australe]
MLLLRSSLPFMDPSRGFVPIMMMNECWVPEGIPTSVKYDWVQCHFEASAQWNHISPSIQMVHRANLLFYSCILHIYATFSWTKCSGISSKPPPEASLRTRCGCAFRPIRTFLDASYLRNKDLLGWKKEVLTTSDPCDDQLIDV